MSKQATCSAIISFAEKLEDASSKFYEKMTETYTEGRETFQAFVEESRKNKVLIIRTYQETISDALEACFIQIDLSQYQYETSLGINTTYSSALQNAIELETKISEFYSIAAKETQHLLATIPRILKRMAEKRNQRILELKSLL
ncbi:MAG: hypothetical protein ACFE9D_11300 [Promethearchaeota archaeon]